MKKSVQLPVIAAIPHYNMSESLGVLLEQLKNTTYDAVYVYDDASSEEHQNALREYERHYKNVHFMYADENKGSGSARNAIVDHLKQPTLIHFLDADVTLNITDPATLIRSIKDTEKHSFIGGLVLTAKGTQDPWNYGPRFSIVNDFRALLYHITSALHLPQSARFFAGHPVGTQQETLHPYWVIEGNMVIHSNVFKKLGGFNEQLREHDIQPMAARAYKAHIKSLFLPELSVTRHSKVNVRPPFRFVRLVKTELYLIRTYIGWRTYFHL